MGFVKWVILVGKNRVKNMEVAEKRVGLEKK